MNKKLVIVLVLLLVSSGSAYLLYSFLSHQGEYMGKRTVDDVVRDYEVSNDSVLLSSFVKADIKFPPKELALLAIKEEKILEVWARNDDRWKKVTAIPITAASGKLGPKLREGDRQVPEGLYKLVGFNPNSSYHLSMKLNYPNEFDAYWAVKEGRTNPGSDIFIHGKAASIGCIAVGDEAIEDLFYAVYRVGMENVRVIIAPRDPRKNELVKDKGSPDWVVDLYKQIKSEFVAVSGT